MCVNLGWKDRRPSEELSHLLGNIPVLCGNDANVAALGEMWKGGGEGISHFFNNSPLTSNRPIFTVVPPTSTPMHLPALITQVPIEEEIKSVFYDNTHVGVIMSASSGEYDSILETVKSKLPSYFKIPRQL